MRLFRKKTIISVTHVTHKGERTKTTEFKLVDAKKHIYVLKQSPWESIRVEVKL
jgi:hypothetical protein